MVLSWFFHHFLLQFNQCQLQPPKSAEVTVEHSLEVLVCAMCWYIIMLEVLVCDMWWYIIMLEVLVCDMWWYIIMLVCDMWW